jgi:hypothetical protein
LSERSLEQFAHAYCLLISRSIRRQRTPWRYHLPVRRNQDLDISQTRIADTSRVPIAGIATGRFGILSVRGNYIVDRRD